MPSATEPVLPASSKPASGLWTVLESWNRKLHFYSGLFLIFFLWLFALSGLLLNHPSWTFHEHWKNRHETNYEWPIIAPGPDALGDLAQARDIMRQLGISGDILWTAYSMDVVAAGLIFMVLSSVYMWLQLPRKRRSGAIVLALGCLSCGLFCFGLRWLF
jgi:hypothetical protein